MGYMIDQSDSDRFLDSEWKFTTVYSPVCVAPPRIQVNIFIPLDDEYFRIMHPISRISDELHDRLLNQSLQEYGDIWRSLAEK